MALQDQTILKSLADMSLQDQTILKSLADMSLQDQTILKSLADMCADLDLPSPIYVQFPNLDSSEGYTSRCDVNNHSETGHGASKKIATRNAARKMFSHLKGQAEKKREILDEKDVKTDTFETEDAKIDVLAEEDVNIDTFEMEDVKIDVLGAENTQGLLALFQHWKQSRQPAMRRLHSQPLLFKLEKKSFFQHWKQSRQPAMRRLHSQPITNPYTQLKQLCEEEGLEFSFEEHDGMECGDGNNNVEEEWQSVLRISTMFVFCGSGKSSDEARSVASRCALMYLRFMTRV